MLSSTPESSTSEAGRALRRLLRNPAAVAGGVMVALLIAVAVLAPWVAPHDPLEQNVPKRFSRPGGDYWLGTDELGRDLLSRLMWGSRISLLVSLVAVSIAVTCGVAIGLLAGYYPRLDSPLMRMIDILLAFPGILLAIAIVSALGPGLINAMIAVGINAIPTFARITRAQALSVRTLEYIQAAQAVGAGDGKILVRHVLPNCLAPIIVYSTLSLATAILTSSVLSFLGLGAQPPTPDWGSMVATSRQFMLQHPHVMLFPTAAVFVTVLAFNFLGDGLRDALDPRLQT